MTEQLLQFIWQHALFQSHGLKDILGKPISIIHPGYLNKNEGPDFFNAKIRIEEIEMVGNVEIHLKSSDWFKHQHDTHRSYQNIILHVVLHNDYPHAIGNFPTLMLNEYLHPDLINRYELLSLQPTSIPCQTFIPPIPSIIIQNWKDRLIIERWQQKLEHWETLFAYLQNDWRQLLFVKLAENFGFKTNAIPMQMLAQSIPLSVLEKINSHLLSVEAVLFGQAGLLPSAATNEYVKQLKNEYQYLQKRFSLQPIQVHWKFLRMRPANFPTIRIAQLASILVKSTSLFNQFLKAKNYQEVEALLTADTNAYWHHHYHFNRENREKSGKALGRQSIENIIINTITPFQFFYGKKMEDDILKEQSLNLLEKIPPEKNNITRLWQSTKIAIHNAACSQALLQLYNNYCNQKKCLQCQIGAQVLKVKN